MFIIIIVVNIVSNVFISAIKELYAVKFLLFSDYRYYYLSRSAIVTVFTKIDTLPGAHVQVTQ